ncbi:MAG: TonB-dependent siderophore receptor [Pelosinus sp.]|nr:TonB-dependent siderophore receptor [Pelosinus sp.]
MKIKKKKIQPLLYGTALAMSLSIWTPNFVQAEEGNTAKTSAVNKQADVPVTEVEVKETKEKKKTSLSIGQQPNAEGVKNYVITKSSTGSKTNEESKDVPQTIAVVGQKVLQEEHANTLEKALTNIAGVNTGTGVWNPNTNLNPSFMSRGFYANNYYVNGLYDGNLAVAGWTGYLDRIEVLKGPSSLYFGQLQPGGVINLITKKPLTSESYKVGLEYGSWGSRSIDLDASVPLTKDKKWLSRTIIDTDHFNEFQKNVYNNHFNGAFIVQGQPRQDTVYTFEATYRNYNITGGYPGAHPAIGSIQAPYGLVAYDANYYDPGQRYYFIGRSLSARVDHKLNEIWTITSALRYSNEHNERHYNGGERWTDSTNTKISTGYDWDIFNIDTYSWDTTGNAKFKAWGAQHNVAIGYEWSRWNRVWPVSVYKSSGSVDAYNPVFVQPSVALDSDSPYTYYRYGSYVSDTVTLSNKLKVSAGLNYSTFADGVGGTGLHTSGTTWRTGANYESSPGLTWFTGYGTSFNTNSRQTVKVGGLTTGYQYFAPRTGDQYEAGVKYNISDKANVTLARYRIRETNIVTNMGTTATTDYQLTDEQVSRGVELDGNYVIRPGWNVLAAYAHNDSRTEKNHLNPALIGKQTQAVPQEMFKLWSTYEVQSGNYKGLGFGGGVTYVGRRPYNSANTVWVPGYSVFDALVYYKRNSWKYALNINNLTNRQYWIEQNGVSVFPGTPRSFTLRVEKSFN